jgi:hypothetical protein
VRVPELQDDAVFVDRKAQFALSSENRAIADINKPARRPTADEASATNCAAAEWQDYAVFVGRKAQSRSSSENRAIAKISEPARPATYNERGLLRG